MSQHVVPPRIYLLVFAALMILMVATLVVTQLEQGMFADLVALTIAIAKAVLIISFFMHVKYSSNLTKLFATAGFVWVVILFAFTFSDYKSRNWEPTRHNFPDVRSESEVNLSAQE